MIDVLIPCIKQDFKLLKLCVEAVRTNVVDQIKNIYVVSPYDEKIETYCNENNLIFVDETTVSDITAKTINKPHSGWIFQQILKMSEHIVECDDYLVIDADHILLKPHRFINEGSYNFYYDSEYHIPYFNSIKDIFNGKYDKVFEHSFISDKMLFNKKLLKELKVEMEMLNNKNWKEIIIEHYKNNDFSFSEFETYGTWLFYNYKQKVNGIYCNRKMSYSKIEDLTFEQIREKYSEYSSITQHKHAQ